MQHGDDGDIITLSMSGTANIGIFVGGDAGYDGYDEDLVGDLVLPTPAPVHKRTQPQLQPQAIQTQL
jgi:hypothetical protein